MKKLNYIALILIFICGAILLSSCEENPQQPTPPLNDITGVVFENAEYTYDGQAKSLSVSNLPTGISVEYSGNGKTDAGTYTVSASLSGEGYNPLTLNATLKINKANIEGVSLSENESIKSDGDFHLPKINGNIPSGVSCNWYFNDNLSNEGVKAVGKYNVRLVLSGNNYNDLTLTSNYEIKLNLLNLANTVVKSFGKTPDAWAFLPDSFKMENLVLSAPAPTYTDFTNVNQIPKCYIGKQMNVVYSLLNKCDTALSYVNTVQSVLNVIEQAYQTFLNNSPDNYKVFEGEVAAFSYKITLSDNNYVLTASISAVEVSLFSDLSTGAYGAKVKLGDGNIIKYEVGTNKFKVAMTALNSAAIQIEFVRDSQNTNLVNGYIYEYLTVAGKDIVSTSAYLYVNDTYTVVIGTKGDFIPTADARNCEVYDNATGSFVGSEVSEVIGEDRTKAYDTMWINLYDIAGIISIKKVDEANVLNPDTIYINGNTDTIHTDIVSITDWSRQYDIEFKTVCAYTYDTETEEYTLVEFEVPLMFIQEKCVDNFEDKFGKKNDVSVTLNLSSADEAIIKYGYHELLNVYNTIKAEVSKADIEGYCSQ